MALDICICKQDKNEHLFTLDDDRCNHLNIVFDQFKKSTGLLIDEYDDIVLDNWSIKILIKIIDEYIEKTNLNTNKKQTSIILEFKGILNIFIENNISMQLSGD
jgi:hypothetical protein